ncbi:MAG: KilA-N domain-containing protein [Bacteroidales bacterium]|nr:KilA-N domain-containing protein [Bacteroidales bacterium]
MCLDTQLIHSLKKRNAKIAIIQTRGVTCCYPFDDDVISTDPVSFKDKNGISFVNATEMAGNFGKIPANWLRTEQSRKIIEAISTSHKCELAKQKATLTGRFFICNNLIISYICRQ